jgi:hypothetical protein
MCLFPLIGFYGKDVHQTTPLPKEYLENIYHSIGEHQIRTQGNDPFSLVTDEEWMDINMMIKTNSYLSLLVSTRQHSTLVSSLLHSMSLIERTASTTEDEGGDEGPELKLEDVTGTELLLAVGASTSGERKESNAETSESSGGMSSSSSKSYAASYSLLKKLFSSQFGWYYTMNLSSLLKMIHGLDWLFDRDLLSCTSSFMLLPGLSVLIYNNMIVEETIYIENTSEIQVVDSNHKLYEWKERTGRLMDLSVEFLLEILSISSKHSLWKMIDIVIAILLQISGLKETDIVQTFIRMVSLSNDVTFPMNSFNGTLIESDPLDIRETTGESHSKTHLYPDHCFFIQRISYGTVQKTLILLLTIISTYYSSVSNWFLLLYPLVILRDFTLLPTDLIFLDNDSDQLPSNVRQEFEFTLHQLDRQAKKLAGGSGYDDDENKTNENNENSKSSSFFAFRLLGEALFGSSSTSNSGNRSVIDSFR